MGRVRQRDPLRLRRRRYIFRIAERAKDDYKEALRYIARSSPHNAKAVGEAIIARIDRLGSFPRGAPIDSSAPLAVLPQGIEARIAHTDVGFDVRYLFPVAVGDDPETIFVVSIRRSSRRPMHSSEFVARYEEERKRE